MFLCNSIHGVTKKKIMHEAILNSFHTFKSEALRTNHQQTICWQHECLQKLPSKCSTVVFIIHHAAEFTYPTTIYNKWVKSIWRWYMVWAWAFQPKVGGPFLNQQILLIKHLRFANLAGFKGRFRHLRHAQSSIFPCWLMVPDTSICWFIAWINTYQKKKQTNHGEHVG